MLASSVTSPEPNQKLWSFWNWLQAHLETAVVVVHKLCVSVSFIVRLFQGTDLMAVTVKKTKNFIWLNLILFKHMPLLNWAHFDLNYSASGGPRPTSTAASYCVQSLVTERSTSSKLIAVFSTNWTFQNLAVYNLITLDKHIHRHSNLMFKGIIFSPSAYCWSLAVNWAHSEFFRFGKL